MKTINGILAAIVLSGCAVDLRSKEPIEVRHVIDISELEKYFEAICRDELISYTQAELEDCVVDHMADFLETVDL